ncbi:hypothetical protein [Kribbella sp. DT2]|uniref:hypothetical protein n=1 Tax=Kribbella sp. DT2 TaxID=3393427 RepID=UPI003CECE132
MGLRQAPADRVAGRSTAVRGKSWFDFHVLRELPTSGKVVRGPNDYLLLGEDFTKACKQTPGFRQGLDGLAELAEVIERSGRKVVFTAGPNKSSVVEPPAVVPDGHRAGAGLLGGKSLIIGDSFSYFALGNLRPLFADGTFLWTGHVSEADLIAAIKGADTVVIQIVQRSITPGHAFATKAFRDKVAAALR